MRRGRRGPGRSRARILAARPPLDARRFAVGSTGYPTGMTENGTTQADQSVAELVKQLTDQTSRLARLEVELAKAELQAKGKQAGLGAGMFGGAAGLAFYGLGALIACAILALDLAVAGWLAALIVALVLFAGAG